MRCGVHCAMAHAARPAAQAAPAQPASRDDAAGRSAGPGAGEGPAAVAAAAGGPRLKNTLHDSMIKDWLALRQGDQSYPQPNDVAALLLEGQALAERSGIGVSHIDAKKFDMRVQVLARARAGPLIKDAMDGGVRSARRHPLVQFIKQVLPEPLATATGDSTRERGRAAAASPYAHLFGCKTKTQFLNVARQVIPDAFPSAPGGAAAGGTVVQARQRRGGAAAAASPASTPARRGRGAGAAASRAVTRAGGTNDADDDDHATFAYAPVCKYLCACCGRQRFSDQTNVRPAGCEMTAQQAAAVTFPVKGPRVNCSECVLLWCTQCGALKYKSGGILHGFAGAPSKGTLRPNAPGWSSRVDADSEVQHLNLRCTDCNLHAAAQTRLRRKEAAKSAAPRLADDARHCPPPPSHPACPPCPSYHVQIALGLRPRTRASPRPRHALTLLHVPTRSEARSKTRPRSPPSRSISSTCLASKQD